MRNEVKKYILPLTFIFHAHLQKCVGFPTVIDERVLKNVRSLYIHFFGVFTALPAGNYRFIFKLALFIFNVSLKIKIEASRRESTLNAVWHSTGLNRDPKNRTQYRVWEQEAWNHQKLSETQQL